MKSGQVNFCLGELFLKFLTQIGQWLQNLSEKTVLQDTGNTKSVKILVLDLQYNAQLLIVSLRLLNGNFTYIFQKILFLR